MPGAAVPFPYGGKQRQVQIDLDLNALRARGLSGNDVVAAVGAQNLVIPAGTQKIGSNEYFVKLNSSPRNIEDLNNLPVKTANGSVVYVRDVAHVRDGSAPQDQPRNQQQPARRRDQRQNADGRTFEVRV